MDGETLRALPAVIAEAAAAREDPGTGSQRSLTIRAHRHERRLWRLEQLIAETWNALSASYFMPRERMAELASEVHKADSSLLCVRVSPETAVESDPWQRPTAQGLYSG